MTKKDDKITKLIESGETELINNRFRVKASVYDDGVHKKSFMVVISDLLQNHFKIRFFNTAEEAASIIGMLKVVK